MSAYAWRGIYTLINAGINTYRHEDPKLCLEMHSSGVMCVFICVHACLRVYTYVFMRVFRIDANFMERAILHLHLGY
jgi:hypothetical protein